MKKLTIATIALAGLTLAGYSSTTNQNLDEFAECLTDKWVVVYTMTTCGYCQKQKAMFGNSWEKIQEINCSETPNECWGIQGVPARNIDGEFVYWLQSFEKLAELSNCELNLE